MAVVVTGAAGFIGRGLTRALLTAGHRVVAVDRQAPPAQHSPGWPDQTSPDRARLTTLTADLLDGDPRVAVTLADADAVVHLAGCSGVRDSTAGIEQRRYRDNVEATQLVADLVPD
ncbi:MAG: NAD-dependent epimerase/dehydratase family protein, partial [Nocardioidaceae bacterium]